jgi:hypothetical protein
MYLEYLHNQNKELLKEQVDKYVAKLNKLEFSGSFKITELHRSWSNYEMTFSLMIKQSFIERRMKGILQVKDELILLEFEVPEIIKNFIRVEKLEHLILKHLDNVIDEVNYAFKSQ